MYSKGSQACVPVFLKTECATLWNRWHPTLGVLAQWPQEKAPALSVSWLEVMWYLVWLSSLHYHNLQKEFTMKSRSQANVVHPHSVQRVNISFYIKDLLYGCIEVSRQVSLIIIALFLTFTTCAIVKKGLNFSGMTFRHWVRYTVSKFHHANEDQYLFFLYRKYKPVNEVATLFLHGDINSGLTL